MGKVDQLQTLSNVRFAGESLRAVIINDASYLEGEKRQQEIRIRARNLQDCVRIAARAGNNPGKILQAISENPLRPPGKQI